MTTTNAIFSTEREREEPTFPFPPRFRWLKRGAILLLLTIGSLALLRGWWGHVATERTREMVDAAHARGEPILPEDFNPAPVPDGQNAALTLSLAASSIYRDAQFDSFDNSFTGDLLSKADMSEVGRIVALNQKAFDGCRRARSQHGADWKIQIVHPMLNTLLPNLSPQRQLASMEKYAVLYDHAKHNDRESVERLRDILHQARALDAGPAALVTHLVSGGIDAIATDIIENLTPALQIANPKEQKVGDPATPRQIRDLISDLLNEDQYRRAVIHAWQGERMFALDFSQFIADGNTVSWLTIPHGKAIWLIGPAFRLDGLRVTAADSQAACAAALPDWPSAQAHLAANSRGETSDIENVSRVFSTFFVPAGTRAVQQHFRILVERRAAAIELALHLYRVEHDGKLPPTLQELVPEYLPYVPADPMARADKPMRYLPMASPPVIYSVGENGIDDGGTRLPSSIYGYRWKQPDAVFQLEPTPTTQPSTQTQNNQ
jgi:hypothetical protein